MPRDQESLQEFLGEQLVSPNFYMLVLATFTMALMTIWRRVLKDAIYWDGYDDSYG